MKAVSYGEGRRIEDTLTLGDKAVYHEESNSVETSLQSNRILVTSSPYTGRHVHRTRKRRPDQRPQAAKGR